MFLFEILNDSQLGNGHETDKKQIGYRWIKLNELHLNIKSCPVR